MGKQAKPFFSVIIATYNRALLIERALESLVIQTESDWEALIIDDGSTDNTINRINRFIKSNGKVRYYYYTHKGMVSAKNSGIRLARGEFITFLDSDDEYDPLHLEIKRKVLKNDPSLQLLYGRTKIIGQPYVPDRYDTSKLIHLDMCHASGNFVFESHALRQLEGFRNLNFGTDADLFDRAVASGLHMKEVGQRTYVYHHETIDSNTNKLMLHVV